MSQGATTINWSGGTSTDFTLGTNWTGGVAPANDLTTAIATFPVASPAFQPSLAGAYSVNGVNMAGGSALSGAGTLTLGSGGFVATGTNTISVSSLKLGANATISLAGATTISSGINTNGFNLGLSRNTNTTGTLNLTNTVISGNGGTVTFNAASGSNLISVGGANSFTGAVSVSQANLNFTTLANGGTNSSFGAGTAAVTLGGSVSFMVLTNIGTGGSTDRLFNANTSGSVGITNNGSGALNFNNTGTYGSLGLSLGGSYTGVNTFAEAIIGAATLGISGSGTWALSGANTYTGNTTVSSGALLVSGSLNGSLVAVNAGTFGGTGTVTTNNQPFTLASGAKLDPGTNGSTGLSINTGTANLDITGGVGGSNTGELLFNLDTTSDSDMITLTQGTLAIGSGLLNLADFHFTTSGGFGIGTYTLFSLDGINATLTGTLATSGLTGTIAGFSDTLAISGNSIVLTVVPEPNTAVSLLGGFGLLLGLQRRRRNSTGGSRAPSEQAMRWMN
jgi:autotransporter-associated beta strand protein